MIDKATRKHIEKCVKSGMRVEELVRHFGDRTIIEFAKQREQGERCKEGRERKAAAQFEEIFSVALSERPAIV